MLSKIEKTSKMPFRRITIGSDIGIRFFSRIEWSTDIEERNLRYSHP